MTIIREALRLWGLAHQPCSDLTRRMAAAQVMRDGCSAGGQIPTAIESRALSALASGAGLDDPCPPDPADTMAVLCAAIDAGDDSALLALADWLEGQGDGMATGLRGIGDRRPGNIGPRAFGGRDQWAWWDGATRHSRAHLGRTLWRRLSKTWDGLAGGRPEYQIPADKRMGRRSVYPTRSAAILALATALAQP